MGKIILPADCDLAMPNKEWRDIPKVHPWIISEHSLQPDLSILQDILKRNPDLVVDVRTIDPRLDPEIEQWIRVLADLIPKMRPLAQGFNACDQAALLPKEDFAGIEHFDLFEGAWRLGSRLLQRELASTINTERNRIGFKTARAWDQYLAQQPPTNVAYGFAARDVNHVIKTCFESWYNKFDQTPEQPLQADFIARLKASNGLGLMLFNWGKLHDTPPKPPEPNYQPDLLSKTEVLETIADMFSASYFAPLGITAPIKLCYLKTTNRKTRTKAYYDQRTEKIVIKVGEKFGQYTGINSGGFYSVWSDATPDQLVLALLEELHHQFAHQIVKKYLAGEFPVDSPWYGYGRTLTPQFLGTPGQKLYTEGSYYLLNPLERAINPLMKEAKTTIINVNNTAGDAFYNKWLYLEAGERIKPLARPKLASLPMDPENPSPRGRRPSAAASRYARFAALRPSGFY